MSSATKKTFSSYLADKVALRLKNLPKGEVTVLDCYAGKGTIWRAVKLMAPQRDIETLPIDTTNNDGFFMPGDNRSFLKIIDLSRFNVVDLDAYGIPYDQLKILFERGYKGHVFVMFIQSLYGQVNKGMLSDLGFSEEMTEKIPTLFGKKGWAFFLEWLALHGVEKIRVRSHSRKHYIFFKMV